MPYLRWLFALSPPADWPLWLLAVHLLGRGLIAFSCLFLPLAFYLSAKQTRPERPRFQVWQALSIFLIGVGILTALTPTMLVWPAWRFLGLFGLGVGLVGVLWTIPATVRYVRWIRHFSPPEVVEALARENEDLRVRLLREERAVLRTVAQLSASECVSARERRRLRALASRVIRNTEDVAQIVARGG